MINALVILTATAISFYIGLMLGSRVTFNKIMDALEEEYDN